VSLVFDQNLSVREASRILKIKYTTAKPLIQKYRKTGNILRKRARKHTMMGESKE
jgi:transposase